jgi:hypothetical protein
MFFLHMKEDHFFNYSFSFQGLTTLSMASCTLGAKMKIQILIKIRTQHFELEGNY